MLSNIILTKIYCYMDNLEFYNVNVEYDFTFYVHLQSK
jgi:hypothetical protein